MEGLNHEYYEFPGIDKKYTSEGEGEFERIIGNREREVKTIISEAYKTAKGIKGAADAKATLIYAEGYSVNPGFYRFWKILELYEQYKRRKNQANPRSRQSASRYNKGRCTPNERRFRRTVRICP